METIKKDYTDNILALKDILSHFYEQYQVFSEKQACLIVNYYNPNNQTSYNNYNKILLKIKSRCESIHIIIEILESYK